jgi:hypothetical protein
LTAWAARRRFGQVNAAALIQLAVSAVAVALMVGLAAWATRGRGAPPLDEAAARTWLSDEFPGRRLDNLWLAADGLGAVAKSGDAALVLSRMGDGYVARRVPWARALAANVKDGRVRIALSDVAAPKVVLALPAWPPKELAA